MKKGFTIVELVIVITVLLILIGIIIPRMKGMQDAGNMAKAKGELQTLQAAQESYYSNNTPHAYQASSTVPSASFLTQTPQIISTSLYDPFVSGGTTQYDLVTNGNYYVFSSVGPAAAALASLTISNTGVVTGTGSGICVTNGTGC